MTYFKIPQKHKCGETLEERSISVNRKILSMKRYPINYCPKCKTYVLNKKESTDPKILGDLITEAQAQTNLKSHNSIYTIRYLKKMREQLNI